MEIIARVPSTFPSLFHGGLATIRERCYTAGMKKLLFLVVLGAAAYFAVQHLRTNAVVQQVQKAPEKYVGDLQKDVSKAQQTADEANKALGEKTKEVEKALGEQP